MQVIVSVSVLWLYSAATLSVPGIQGTLKGAVTWNNQSEYVSFETSRGKLNVYFIAEIVKNTHAESTILDQVGILAQVLVHLMTAQLPHTASTT